MSAPILLVKTGRAVPAVAAEHGTFEKWFGDGLGVSGPDLVVVDPFGGDALPSELSGFGGVVITGSPSMVTDREPWSVRTAAFVPSIVEAGVPLLGVCYGHQLIADALGGVVGSNPRGREIGTAYVSVTDAEDDALFGPLARELTVQVSHLESVLKPPPGAISMGTSELESHHILRFAPKAWGVQFHPEMSDGVARGYIDARREAIAGEGLDPDQLIRDVRASADGHAVLRRFRELTLEA